ncbi:class I SAM-dependent methyltransferase [Paenibacillus antarcticus]|uniref:Methyltransferase type 11 n=1 Tax=Paenibacillus antarcticus TaxID=253703 RepID=A0A168MXT3_9BACL|nr:class I SAM-dependent methyltransferase [Paenibacillus antarcticus]OAB45169.1 methyltransferase type 11 [Paenibacillus antarcticus]
MTINFHDENNKFTYTTRIADTDWNELIKNYIYGDQFTALDLGCGGGIYSKVLSELGASKVIAMDFSRSNLEGAMVNCKGFNNISYEQGNALDTGLSNSSVDLVLERALIHHIPEIDLCFAEAARILKPGGILFVQDRTPEDCLLPGSETHIRGCFFEKYPRLIEKETRRRFSSDEVISALTRNEFEMVEEVQFWEARKTYQEFSELEEDLRGRTGRSILHELNDEEVEELIQFIHTRIDDSGNVIQESDRWTIWIARKKV